MKEAHYLLVVDIDPKREVPVVVTHAHRNGDRIEPSNKPDSEYDIISDMSKLCEGICLMIHLEHKEGTQKDYVSLEHGINHLKLANQDAYYPHYDLIENDAVLIDVGGEKKGISIVQLQRSYKGGQAVEQPAKNIHTMHNLCEALVTLIFRADENEKKDKATALADCINHLKEGFKDASYVANSTTTDNW